MGGLSLITRGWIVFNKNTIRNIIKMCVPLNVKVQEKTSLVLKITDKTKINISLKNSGV